MPEGNVTVLSEKPEGNETTCGLTTYFQQIRRQTCKQQKRRREKFRGGV